MGNTAHSLICHKMRRCWLPASDHLDSQQTAPCQMQGVWAARRHTPSAPSQHCTNKWCSKHVVSIPKMCAVGQAERENASCVIPACAAGPYCNRLSHQLFSSPTSVTRIVTKLLGARARWLPPNPPLPAHSTQQQHEDGGSRLWLKPMSDLCVLCGAYARDLLQSLPQKPGWQWQKPPRQTPRLRHWFKHAGW